MNLTGDLPPAQWWNSLISLNIPPARALPGISGTLPSSLPSALQGLYFTQLSAALWAHTRWPSSSKSLQPFGGRSHPWDSWL